MDKSTLELYKLIGIIATGLILGVIGQIIIVRNKKAKKLKDESAYSNYSTENSMDSNEENYSNETIKIYIEQYKATYSRDSIKTALVNSGNSADEVEKYLNKFF